MKLQSMSEKISEQRIKHIGTMVLKEVRWQLEVAALSRDIAELKAKVKEYGKKTNSSSK